MSRIKPHRVHFKNAHPVKADTVRSCLTLLFGSPTTETPRAMYYRKSRAHYIFAHRWLSGCVSLTEYPNHGFVVEIQQNSADERLRHAMTLLRNWKNQ